MEVCRVVTTCLSLLITLMTWPVLRCEAQTQHPVDEFSFDYDTLSVRVSDDSVLKGTLLTQDTTYTHRRDWSTWRPNPKRALWLAVVLPGAGQIYNRKYWKLPIVYGGFVGCIYAMSWNNQMYRDYSQAYLDITDNDPTTQSYSQYMHFGNEITEANMPRYKSLFKKRKDYYRRFRDLSFFVLVGVYAISVIDAYVDATLSEFDLSKDLSMRVSPAVLNSQTDRHPLRSSALGLQCSIQF